MSRFLIEIPVRVYDVEAKQGHDASFGFDVEAIDKYAALHRLERALLHISHSALVAPLEWNGIDTEEGGVGRE